jgi:hypothetical protein
MQLLLRAAIVALALPLLSHGDSAANAGVNVIPVAHFALIRPEADSSNDQPEPTAEAVWLRRPGKPGRTASSPSDTKTKSLVRTSEKPAAAVTPLKRDRPKREVDPPKTRRRQLGW